MVSLFWSSSTFPALSNYRNLFFGSFYWLNCWGGFPLIHPGVIMKDFSWGWGIILFVILVNPRADLINAGTCPEKQLQWMTRQPALIIALSLAEYHQLCQLRGWVWGLQTTYKFCPDT